MKNHFLLVSLLTMGFIVKAQLMVSQNNRFLETADGKPFFWLGDTARERFHRLTPEEAETTLSPASRINAVSITAYKCAAFWI